MTHLASARLGGDLDPAELAHLETCARCRAKARLARVFAAEIGPGELPARLSREIGDSLGASRATTSAAREEGWEVVRWLGSGPHGTVWEVRQAGRRGAMKVLASPPPRPLPRHPNLAEVWVSREDRLVGEYVDGEPLLHALAGASPAVAAEAFLQVVDALLAVGGRGNLKPGNLRVEPGGRVVLIDAGFGEGDDLDALRDLLAPWGLARGAGMLEEVRAALAAARGGGRYADLGRIGLGGMGEVRRVRDAQLDRTAAMKLLRADAPGAAARFEAEARVTARLQHPGIVPVYELGRTPDGRPYYTMREIEGVTLARAVREGWPLRRLADALLRVSEAVAFAHAAGVVHRDLKPANVMLGRFGEVLVLDWGLAREVRAGPDGAVVGTPAYMPPEQAASASPDPRADVYALGAVLWEVLCGRPPYAGVRSAEVLADVRAGPPPAPTGPDELVALCLRAMARDPADRPAHAGEFADLLRAWLDGARRRERALERLAEADRVDAEVTSLRARAAARLAEARTLLAEARPHEPEGRKAPGWAAEDEARALAAAADRAELQWGELVRSALVEAPDLDEARARLADRYAARLAEAEAARDHAAAASWEVLLRANDRGRWAAWLEGSGALVLRTDVPAEARLLRFSPSGRRLVPVPVRSLGPTPVEVPLAMGSWLVEIVAAGRPTVRYPVSIARGERWEADVRVPAALGPDEVFVPAGPFWAGGDPAAATGLARRRLWCDDFAIARHPVTNREFLVFLDDLVACGREEDALRHAPRERPGALGQPGALIYGRDADGRFVLVPDAEGDVWDPDWPVVNVDQDGARAYCAWLAARTGLPWRLPMELEWEKAARGVDGRLYPWGDFLDPTWCNVRESHAGRQLPARVDAHPVDESPYGVRGLAGNVRDRCADLFSRERPDLADGRVLVDDPTGEGSRVLRGGSWGDAAALARSAERTGAPASLRGGRVGFRVARSFTP
ncbi:MAG: SUMF1/EgtB/PvdO family nonheme iron enzyme [Myxococcota bacterium]